MGAVPEEAEEAGGDKEEVGAARLGLRRGHGRRPVQPDGQLDTF